MPCYHPLKGYRASQPGASGKFGVVFKPPHPDQQSIDIPCGRCIGCRLERSRQWAVRCLHEASLYDQNCFVTLTYDNKHLPAGGNLVKSDLQKFFKRLRKRFGKFRYYACGEYGSELGRPHFHACIFGFDFADKCLWSVRGGVRLYVSADLVALWPFGFSTIGQVTFESAAYVARYVTKKITGDMAKEHYTRFDSTTGEFWELTPEFNVMSRRPGIAKPWLDKYMSDVFPGDFVISRGREMKPPRYYDVQFEKSDVWKHFEVKRERMNSAKEHAGDNTPRRLQDKEAVAVAKLNLSRRSIT